MSRSTSWFARTLVAAALAAGAAPLLPPSMAVRAQSPATRDQALAALAELQPIDAHVHLYRHDAAFGAMFERLRLRALNILLIDSRDPYAKAFEPQWSDAVAARTATSGRAAVGTTIDPYGFEDAGFARAVTARLDQDFAAGAVAVKLYKVMGMHVRTKAGAYVLPDDPAYAPVLEHIASKGRTVVAHVAEPDSCWLPLDPASPDYGYYKQNPQEHAFTHPEWPKKEAILAARDRMLAAHPTLKVVGAHLGSMEVDVDQIAQRFDRHPNFAVDTAARIVYFMRQPPEKVRAFLVKYQDRVLYGTDLVTMPKDDPAEGVRAWEQTYERDWRYFATTETVAYEGGTTRGLGLPEPVLRKFFHDNAARWIPGVEGRR
jgi:predicted TIM-barrel fold metal-dependent hydrolase